MTKAVRNSCISHPAREPLAILREGYKIICAGNECAALLLNAFEHLANRYGETWIMRSFPELIDDILEQYGETKVRESLKELEKLGFLQSRKNKVIPRDQTKEWLLMVDAVQAALNNVTFNQTSEVRSANLESEASSLYVESVVDKDVDQLLSLYESEIGAATPMVLDQLKDWLEEYGLERIKKAIGIAVDANVRQLRYVRAVLEGKGKFARTGNGKQREITIRGEGTENG